MVVVPKIPQDITDEISDLLAADSDFQSLQSCALLSKSWIQSCRRHLFRIAVFTSRNAARWFKTFPEPENSPAHHVRVLCVRIGGADCVPDRFFEYILWFTDVVKVYLLGHGSVGSSLRPSLWRLPQSITSLTIDTSVFALVQVWEIMAQLPNLDDLSLSGSHSPVRQGVLISPEIGMPLRGRFGGRLVLSSGWSGKGVIGKLLEVPSGLRFTEVEISSTRSSLLSAVSLVEACSKTLVKLSQTVYFLGKPFPLLPVQLVLVHETLTVKQFPDVDRRETFKRSFDFSKSPNLQEVTLICKVVGATHGGLPWLPMSLSTLKPATSTHLSTIRLDFSYSHSFTRPAETLTESTGDDLRRVADEAFRIEREFEGAVHLTTHRDAQFEVVFGILNVRFRCVASWSR